MSHMDKLTESLRTSLDRSEKSSRRRGERYEVQHDSQIVAEQASPRNRQGIRVKMTCDFHLCISRSAIAGITTIPSSESIDWRHPSYL
jgi:hypothetical protein